MSRFGLFVDEKFHVALRAVFFYRPVPRGKRAFRVFAAAEEQLALSRVSFQYIPTILRTFYAGRYRLGILAVGVIGTGKKASETTGLYYHL